MVFRVVCSTSPGLNSRSYWLRSMERWKVIRSIFWFPSCLSSWSWSNNFGYSHLRTNRQRMKPLSTVVQIEPLNFIVNWRSSKTSIKLNLISAQPPHITDYNETRNGALIMQTAAKRLRTKVNVCFWVSFLSLAHSLRRFALGLAVKLIM